MKLMLIAGFGFRASADIHSLANAFEKTATGGLVDGFSAPADKIDHPALTALARCYELPVYAVETETCLLYTSPSPRDRQKSRMPSSA